MALYRVVGGVRKRIPIRPGATVLTPPPVVAAGVAAGFYDVTVPVAELTSWGVASGFYDVADPNPRDSLVLGAYMPDETTTGVLPGTVLTARTSGQPVPGGVYENIDWQMQVVLPAGSSTITFRNCKFSGGVGGPPNSSTEALLKATSANHCFGLFIDCTFRPQTLNERWNAFLGYGYKCVRCDVSYVCDSWSVYNTNDPSGPLNVTIEQCYSHDHWWTPASAYNSAYQGDGSHHDSVQLQGGSGFVARGTNFQGYSANLNEFYGDYRNNGCFIIKPDVGLITGAVITDNWFGGGGSSQINFANDSPDRVMSGTNLVATVQRNKFFRDSSRTGKEVLVPSGMTPIPNIDFGTGANRNVFVDDPNGAAVPVSPGGPS